MVARLRAAVNASSSDVCRPGWPGRGLTKGAPAKHLGLGGFGTGQRGCHPSPHSFTGYQTPLAANDGVSSPELPVGVNMIIKSKTRKKNRRQPRGLLPTPDTVPPPIFAAKSEDRQRGVLFAPEVRWALVHGAEVMAAPLAATLGPLGRTVAVASFVDGTHPPELLDDAATIARRVIELPNRYVNAGAMLIRHLAWHVRETRVGDGSATAAVLAREMIRGGVRMIAAGASPAILRRGMECGVRAALDELVGMAQPLDSEAGVVGLARAVTGDAELADLLAEIFDVVGVDGTIVVQNYVAPLMDREYVEGIQWDSGLASTEFVTDAGRQETVLKDPMIALADLKVTGASQLVPVLEQAMQAGAESLVIIAEKFEGDALGALRLNQGKLPNAPINAPKPVLQRAEILKDLAILTGGTVIDEKAGRRLEGIRREDFGRARRVIATRQKFTIVGAKGRQREIRRRMAELKNEAAEEVPTARLDTLRRRLANLSGGVAILRIGAISKQERKLKREKVEDAIRAVRAALQDGTVPGGGAAYLACIPALEALQAAGEQTDEAMGIHVVAEALAAPLKQIAKNAGYSGVTMAAKARAKGPGHGFDAFSGEVVDMREAGIVDPAKVQGIALEAAASTAAMVLMTEAVVLTGRAGMPDMGLEP